MFQAVLKHYLDASHIMDEQTLKTLDKLKETTQEIPDS